jgi:hypothetical protein
LFLDRKVFDTVPLLLRLSSDDEDSEDEAYDVKQAHERLVTLAVLDDDSDSGMSDTGDSSVLLCSV